MAPLLKTNHIGSLIRPQYLTDAHNALVSAKQSLDATSIEEAMKNLKKLEKSAINEVVSYQLEKGITPITSGEFERAIFFEGFFEALDGVETQFLEWHKFRKDHPIMPSLQAIGWGGMPIAVATGKIKWVRSAYMAAWLYVKSLLPETHWSQVKMTLPSPNWPHELGAQNAYTENAYSSDEEYLMDAARALRQEVVALYEAGLRIIQIDDPGLTLFLDQKYQPSISRETNPDALLTLYTKTHNFVLADLPADLTIGIHLCRGNLPQGGSISDGPYDPIAARLFRELNYKRYYLEYDNDRSGSFEALQYLPAGKVAVLGIVTTKSAAMESLSDLKARVLEAADVIAKAQSKSREEALRENLAVSPQCGFASSVGASGVGMSEEVQWRKLELVKQLAEELWPGDIA